ncbi:putative leader peptide [Streptomyces polygonati]|uniref:Leader peptide n=1 Tax=Streptomyces polygonati TaxID=1617087 RepID=A0ABV8HV40_9ACTN
MQVRRSGNGGTSGPRGFAQLMVARRHVDLLRVSSALCPGISPVC